MNDININWNPIETIPIDKMVMAYLIGFINGECEFSYSLVALNSKTSQIEVYTSLFHKKEFIFSLGAHYVAWADLDDETMPFKLNNIYN